MAKSKFDGLNFDDLNLLADALSLVVLKRNELRLPFEKIAPMRRFEAEAMEEIQARLAAEEQSTKDCAMEPKADE